MRFPPLLICLLFTLGLSSQTDVLYGTWAGKIEVENNEIFAVIYVEAGDTIPYFVTFAFPEQGIEEMKPDKYYLTKDSISINLKKIRAKYKATYNDSTGTINGKWIQGGKAYKLNLEKTEKDYHIKRPQTPQKPYPYTEEEIIFTNLKDKIDLSGTLTIPQGKGPFPAVLIINGSGQQERDCEILGHKWALVLADYLTRQGIATFRYDDRGTGKSGGNPFTSTTLDYSEDALSAAMVLRNHNKTDKSKIGIIGHSEGGIIAQIISSKLKGTSFVVLLAAPGIDITELMVIQNRKMIEGMEILNESQLTLFDNMNRSVFNTILNTKDNNEASAKVLSIYMDYAKTLDSSQIKSLNIYEKNIRSQLTIMLSPWYRFFLSVKPSRYLTKIKCPVLVLNGEKDVQVTADENLAAINDALKKAKNSKVTVNKLTGLNHLFQTSESGMPDEYAKIEETISPAVLEIIAKWINQQ